MRVCQQHTADYDIQKHSTLFMPSLPQPLISYPEAATLLASTVPLDKGGKGSKDEISLDFSVTNLVPRLFWLFGQSPQKCKRTLGRDCLTTRTS